MNYNFLLATVLMLLSPLPVFAQSDTIKAKELDEITVDASRKRLGAQKSVFLPTKDQKKSAMSGPDLVRRLSIPMLKPSGIDGVATLNGKKVNYFIDFMPATQKDLEGMRTTDVKSVEYYEFPTDPRFQGAQHVINFVMVKLNYGGYVRAGGQANILVNSGQADAYGKLQVKSFSFDFFGGLWGRTDRHFGSEQTEIYNLPQPDGAIKTFQRLSITDKAKKHSEEYWLGGRISWLSKNITVRNFVSGSWNRTPIDRQHGSLTYSPAEFPASDYISSANNHSFNISYSGNIFINLPKGNSLSFIPSYTHMHTRTGSEYTETGSAPIINGANDNSNYVGAQLRFNHSFGKAGTLMTAASGSYLSHKTSYSGSSDVFDQADNSSAMASLSYSATLGKIYIYAGGAVAWYKNKLGRTKETGLQPSANISAQWSATQRQSLSLGFAYNSQTPSDNLKSTAVVKVSPLMSITGNPGLSPVDNYNFNASYTYMLRSNLSLSAYGSADLIHNRYVTAYTATSEGILRTYLQPAGAFRLFTYGISSSLSLLSDALNLNASLQQTHTHNGNPYNWNKNTVNLNLGAFFYKGNFNFGAYYVTPIHSAESNSGVWTKRLPIYYLQAGWSNGALKARILLRDFAKWDYKGARSEMKGGPYSYSATSYSVSNHAFVKLEVYYTLGFGKKVTDRNESYRAGDISTGILK